MNFRTGHIVVQATLVAIALAALAFPLPAGFIERYYVPDVYLPTQRFITPIANLIPLAIFDVLLVVSVVWVMALLLRGVRSSWRDRQVAPVAKVFWRLLVFAASTYIAFLAVWGLNYQRVPLSEKLEMVSGVPEPEAVMALGLEAASRLNDLYMEVYDMDLLDRPWQTTSLREGFSEIQVLLGADVPAVPGRLKPTVLGPYFRWTGVSGMINPFALESLASQDLLAFEQPFVAAHEWAHLAGYADEAEASFVGWLTCLRSGELAAYSGWLALFAELTNEVTHNGRTKLFEALNEGPLEDLTAITERQQRNQIPLLRRFGWSIYDRYLRANRVGEGVRRYGAVVTLATQTSFTAGWTPIRRIDSEQ